MLFLSLDSADHQDQANTETVAGPTVHGATATLPAGARVTGEIVQENGGKID